MNPNLLLGLVLLLFSSIASGQQHGVRVNANYLLTQDPIFMLGYEYSADSSSWGYNLNIDGGRYVHRSSDSPSSSIDTYVVRGMGLEASVRKYFSFKYPGPYGWFLSSFTHLNTYKEEEQSGISQTTEGYAFDDPTIETNRYQTLRYGLATGFRSGCKAHKLHVEGLAGWYFGDHGLHAGAGKFYDNLSLGEKVQRKIKIELNLVVIF
jgi:hypothetical protein